MEPIGYFIMVALLGAGAAYGLANKGKPKPAVTWTQKRILMACGGIVSACGLLLLMLILLAPPR